mgnify:CR=1 FL=1
MKNNKIKEQIVKFLEKQEWPVTTEEVAKETRIAWHTAQVNLLKLVAEGKVKYKKVGRQNQFWLVKGYKENF